MNSLGDQRLIRSRNTGLRFGLLLLLGQKRRPIERGPGKAGLKGILDEKLP
ncbi:MAG: hypothetical protein ABI972_09680 [Acidobacteriota bacterium]